MRGAGEEAWPGGGPDAVAAGHFTTLQLRDGRVQGRDLHLLRLRQQSEALWGIGTHKGRLLAAIASDLRAAGGPSDATVRVCVRPAAPGGAGAAAEGGGLLFSPQGPGQPRLRVDVEVGPPRYLPAEPSRVRSHPGIRAAPLVKHLALAPQFEARAAAQAAGFDDALLVTADGRVAEGSFWTLALWDGRSVTWPLAPALPGVTWRLLAWGLDDAGIPQQRVPVRLEALGSQRAAWAVNSTGIRPIASVDGLHFAGDPEFGERLSALLAAVPWDPL